MKQNYRSFMPIPSIKDSRRYLTVLMVLMITVLQSFAQNVESIKIDGKSITDWRFYPGNASFITVNLDAAAPAAAQKYVIYVNNVPISKVYPIAPVSGNALNFKFDFADDQIKAWKDFFHAFNARDVLTSATISVGPETGIPLLWKDVQAQPRFNVRLVEKNGMLAASIFGAVLIIAFLLVLFLTDIFRDPKVPGESASDPKGKKPFSLSRIQFGIWNILILYSAIFIYVFTDKLLAIPAQLLALIGISGSQFIVGWALTKTDTEEYKNSKTSGSLLKDVSTSDESESVHRFQNILWSVALWIYFVQALIVTVDYPAIDTSLLLLTGFTVGLYAYGKTKETAKQLPKQTPKQ